MQELSDSPSLSKSTGLPVLSRRQLIARARAIIEVTVIRNRWIPDRIKSGLTPKQAEFLCFEGREALYGGAAGGGKSVALLIAALQYVDEPGYSALILRRTFKQLAKSDSILNKSKEWLWGKARWNGDEKKWTFPSGATLEFGHMEHEDSRFDYQGGAWPFIGVDEATQFTKDQIAYPRTRQRRPVGSTIPIRWRGASNPGGIGHEYIKSRYVKDGNGKSPCGPQRAFFPATIDDNPNIDRADYLETLRDSGVDPLTLAQLLRGDWDAVAGGRFARDWFRYYDKQGDYCRLMHTDEGLKPFLPRECLRFLTVDPAASAKRTADYTVISAWCVSPWQDLVWLDCVRVQKAIPDIVPIIQQSVLRWKPAFVAIESVAANSAVFQLAGRAKDPAINTRSVSPLSQDKLVRASAAMNLAHSGRVYLPSSNPLFPLDDVLAELVRFTGDESKDDHDDIVDTFSYAVECITGMPTKEDLRGSAPRVYGGS